MSTLAEGGGGVNSGGGSSIVGNAVGGGGGDEGGVAVEELQDGDTSSLEPGELVTPPRNINSPAPAGAKKMLAKDLMSKTLRKLTAATQIDGHENGEGEVVNEETMNATEEEKARSMLELEVIRRKEEKLFNSVENGMKDGEEVDGRVTLAKSELPADDDEGLYSDTDSSEDGQQQQLQQNLEDVQQARKEKQMEAAAAQAQAQAPPMSSPHRFLRSNPLRFHNRPVCFDFPRMSFMPRMVMLGGMRGPRPPPFFNSNNSNRSKTPQRLASPMGSASGSPALTPGSKGGPGAAGGPVYGPVLPPSIANKPQSDVMWTLKMPPVSYVFNLVNGCGNLQHKGCKHKESSGERKDEKDQKGTVKLKDHKSESKREVSKDRKSPKSGERIKEIVKERQKDRFKEKVKESSKEGLTREKFKDKSREEPKEKSKDEKLKTETNSNAHTKDKSSDDSKGKFRDETKEKYNTIFRSDSSKGFITSSFNSTSKHQSKDSLQKDPKDDLINSSKEQSRDLSKEAHRERNQRDTCQKPREQPKNKSKETHQERSRDRNSCSKEPTKDCKTEKSRGRSTDKPKERSRESKARSEDQTDRPRERSKERHSNRDRDKDRDQETHRKRSRSRSRPAMEQREKPGPGHTRSRSKTRHQSEIKAQTPLPPAALPLTEMSPIELPSASSSAQSKHFDIFAESPPRLITTATESKIAEPLPTPAINVTPKPVVERSTTPPLDSLYLSSKSNNATPLLRASEIHLRIGALLEDDDDLHLETLLASTERLVKKLPPNDRTESSGWPLNPFKREVVLNNGQTEWDRERDKDKSRDKEKVTTRTNYLERRIKIEKNRSPTPPQGMLMPKIKIKVERNMTPPSLPLPAAAFMEPSMEEPSPDTDDYIDNWENDDSLASMPKITTKTEVGSNKPTITAANFLNGDLADDDSNTLWNAKSTPPPKAKQGQEPATPNIIDINDVYDRFLTCIEEAQNRSPAITENYHKNGDDGEDEDNAEDSSTESSSTSTSSSTNSSSDSSSSSESDDSTEDTEDEKDGINADDKDKKEIDAETELTESNNKLSNPNMQKRNTVSKDLRKLKNLEDNLGRIQMMRENYDPGDDICEELLKMESLFQMQRNAIMDKYRKHEQLKNNANEVASSLSGSAMGKDDEQIVKLPNEPRPPSPPVNSIFDANREAIKLTISPLKLTRKPAIFDKDDTEQHNQQQQQHQQQQKTTTPTRPPKEIAIVKPTILESRNTSKLSSGSGSAGGSKGSSRRSTRERTLSRSRSISRQRLNRRRSTPSPKRWRPPSPIGRRGSSRTRFAKSRRSRTRSRTRSRSPHRRGRRSKYLSDEGRRRKPLSPLRQKNMGPRSPPPPARRRSYSRSRSPLPFKPPSPPMRRSWTRSPPSKRRSTRSRSRSRSRSRTPISPQRQSFADYFEENPGLEAAAACYYYNMYHEDQDATMAMGDNYADGYAAYMDSSSYTNMEQAYAQYTEYNAQYDYGTGLMESNIPTPGFLRELPKAAPVAVQKGNVLEIVPSAGLDIPNVEITPKPTEEPIEDKSKPKRKRVNFVDNVLPNYESESEDRSIVERAVERALHQYREKRSTAAAKLQRIRDELMALPPPPPPLTPKPPNLEKPVVVQKKPKFLYFHFDPHKGAIIKAHTRLLRPPAGGLMPRFDPKRFAMLMKSGCLPPLPPHFLRQRPPLLLPPHADATTKAAIFKEFFSKHPPPPLPNYPLPIPRPNETSDPAVSVTAANSVPVGGVPVDPAASAGASQPIPVLGSGGLNNFIGYSVPAPLPVPPIAVEPLSLPPALPLPHTYFTPPPLPQFTVQSVPSIREIMQVDILQKIGPLPKTLDLEEQPISSTAADESSLLSNTDLSKEKLAESTADPSEQQPQPEQSVVEQPPPQPVLVETQ